jgi:ribosome maturation factor RimP
MIMELAKIEENLTPLLEGEGVELVDLKFVQEGHRWVLKVFLDKTGGITLADCEYFSDRVGAALDEGALMGKSYVLEVSSPGLDRVLKKEKDFKRFAGKAVKVRLKLPVEGRRQFKGRLLGFEDGKVVVESEGKAFQFALEQIDEARLEAEVEF